MGKTVYTKITPLPANIPRQLALELLHSHEEVIQLNPLVTGVRSIEAPRNASTDEYYSSWYEISQIITWGLGIKSRYSFKGVFHDQPWGLQTHVYAPLGVDMRNKYRIGGNQPGEPREARELGVDTPVDGLYLREDVEITCNVAMMGIVKKEAKEATGIMINRLTRKAELLDEGKLLAMFEHGKLKTSKPRGGLDEFGVSPPSSPTFMYGPNAPASPALSQASTVDNKGYGKYHDLAHSHSYRGSVGSIGSANSSAVGYQPSGASNLVPIHEMPISKDSGRVFYSELPGDQTFQPGQASSPKHSTPVPYVAYAPRPSSQLSQQASEGSWSQTQQQQQQQEAHPVPQALQPGFQVSNSDAALENTTATEHTESIVDPLRQQESEDHVAPAEEGPEMSEIDPSDLLQPHGNDWPLPLRTRTPSPAPPQPPATPAPANAVPVIVSPPAAAAEPIVVPPPPSGPPPLPARNDKRLSFVPADLSPETATPADRMSIISASASASTAVAKCPVCNVFEGDEAAVTHHVAKSHFD